MVTPVGIPFDALPPTPGAVPIHLLGYLAQLPLCGDSSELLQTTLAQALRLTGATAGVAGVAGATADDLLSEGPASADLRAAVLHLLPTPTDDGEVTLSAAPEPAVWTEALPTVDGSPLTILYAGLPAEGQLQGLLALLLRPDQPLTAAMPRYTGAGRHGGGGRAGNPAHSGPDPPAPDRTEPALRRRHGDGGHPRTERAVEDHDAGDAEGAPQRSLHADAAR